MSIGVFQKNNFQNENGDVLHIQKLFFLLDKSRRSNHFEDSYTCRFLPREGWVKIYNVKVLHFYRTQVYLGSDLWVRVSLNIPCADLTELTLAEDTNPILSNNAKAMWQCRWLSLVGFVINAIGAIWWPNLQLMQVAPSGGQICN